ncbi:hypothetical protein DPMN_076565 [Dreissena polymorpha]|uniref:Uncharacterized protein n=1 Tax=Dreissena polymorpha TaxID=45954 RepID=A0A9D3YJA4_DREPO|nr:hypothetical protein DPMN_076565 [Dreissena polymorpha]
MSMDGRVVWTGYFLLQDSRGWWTISSPLPLLAMDKHVRKSLTLHLILQWPEVRVIKPRGLEQCRAQSASATVVHNYFAELDKILDKYAVLTSHESRGIKCKESLTKKNDKRSQADTLTKLTEKPMGNN